jgi:hypothetical protein
MYNHGNTGPTAYLAFQINVFTVQLLAHGDSKLIRGNKFRKIGPSVDIA